MRASQARPASPVERGLIEALVARFPAAAPPRATARAGANAGYAAAMRAVYRSLRRRPGRGGALRRGAPWPAPRGQLWDMATGEPGRGRGHRSRRIAVLEQAMAQPRRPGASRASCICTYTLLEMSPARSARSPPATPSGNWSPMPAISATCPPISTSCAADYREVMSGNGAAIVADAQVPARSGARRTSTRCTAAHDHHFKIYGAMFLGQDGAAREAADQSAAGISPRTCCGWSSLPMADWLEAFVPMRLHVLIRFGLLAARSSPRRSRPTPPCTLVDHRHVPLREGRRARGHRSRRAAAARAGAVRARRRARAPDAATSSTTPAGTSSRWPGPMLGGELAYRRGDPTRRSRFCAPPSICDDNLPYDEPRAGCSRPATRSGALLLEQGRGRGGGSGLPRGSRPRRHAQPGHAGTPETSGACTAITSA